MSERDPRTADRSDATAQGDGDDRPPNADAAGTTGSTAATSGATSGDALDDADPTATKSRGRKEPPDGSKTSMSNVR